MIFCRRFFTSGGFRLGNINNGIKFHPIDRISSGQIFYSDNGFPCQCTFATPIDKSKIIAYFNELNIKKVQYKIKGVIFEDYLEHEQHKAIFKIKDETLTVEVI